MKFSEQWLREWVNPEIDSDELAAQLTMHGLEVASVMPVAADFFGVVVGEVVEIRPHPNADKLKLCRVDIDQADLLDIVCGAKNVAQGMRVAVAIVGASLPGFKIKRSKIRGVESHGMLCSAAELGIGEKSAGIISLHKNIELGSNLRDVLCLNDKIFDIELTPNRGDCLSVEGIAREVSAISKCKLHEVGCSPVKAQIKDTIPIKIDADLECPHYCGRIIRGIDAEVETPLWMKERLKRSDINPISPIVDVTNYVLLELGQPMHAFDLSKLKGAINIRLAKSGEQLTLLDERRISLLPHSCVIADNDNVQALAGIMGGIESAVTDRTRDIFLESAFFDPASTAISARSYGLHTDSSHRFERGVDTGLQVKALERATKLLLDIAGGKPSSICEVTANDKLLITSPVRLRRSRISTVLGISISDNEILDILQRLGMLVRSLSDGWEITPPSFRYDIKYEVDLIEELARIHGYDNIPQTMIKAELTMKSSSEKKLSLGRIKSLLVDRDYREIVTYSFVDNKLQNALNPERNSIKVRNPIAADMAVMRTTLWTGLISSLLYNLRHQQQRIRFFEVGNCFVQQGEELLQRPYLAGLTFGDMHAEQWAIKSQEVDFYDIKGDVETLLQLSGVNDYEFVAKEHAALHPGKSAAIYKQGKEIGYLGALHPKIAEELNIRKNVYLFEMNLSCAYNALVLKFNAFSKYPQIRRDIAILVSYEITADEIINKIRKFDADLLRDTQIFDIYRGQEIGNERKSVAISLLFQANDRTLIDSEIEEVVAGIVRQLKSEFNITMRV